MEVQWIFVILLSILIRNFRGTCSCRNAEGVYG